jgi:N-acetylmuramoyl-L-alanine amidase
MKKDMRTAQELKLKRPKALKHSFETLALGMVCGLLLCSIAEAKVLHVIVDPGHGGRDQGATRGHLQEASIALAVGKKLQALLHSDPFFEASLTRADDRSLNLKQRAKLARQRGGDIFLSIHANASSDHRARGLEVYFQNQLPPDQESLYLANKENARESISQELQWPLKVVAGADQLKGDIQGILQNLQHNHRLRISALFAEAIAQNWEAPLGLSRKKVRQAPFYVVSQVNMPSVLVELGFLTHKNEGKLLNTKGYQKKMAQNLYRGLRKFKEVMDNPLVSRLD